MNININNQINFNKKILFSAELKVLVLFFFIYLYPIITSNSFYYNDDISRSILGYTRWSTDGRPFADLFNSLFSYDLFFIANTYPFPTLVSTFILAYVLSTYVILTFSEKTYFIALLFCLLISNPLFLQNLYFKFDSSFMILSIAWMIIPFISLSKSNLLMYLIAILSIVLSLCSYQASLSIFVFMACTEFFINSESKMNSLKKAALRFSQLILSVAIYTALISYLPLNDHFINFQNRIPFDKYFVVKVIENYKQSFVFVRKSLGSILMAPFYLSAIGFLISCFMFFLKKKYFTLFVSLISVILIILAIPITMTISKNPMFMPRIYIGFGALIIFMLIIGFYAGKFLDFYSRSILLFSLFIYTTASYKVTNAVMLQQNHYDNIAKQVNSHLNTIGIKDKIVSVVGYPRLHDRIENLSKKIPLYEAMKLNYFDGGILILNGLNTPLVRIYSGNKKSFKVILETDEYNILSNGKNVLVVFN